MAKDIRKKDSFGTVRIDHFSPPPKEDGQKSLNIILSFEDALKLQVGLQALLLQLNSYDRSTRAGKNAAVCLCVFPPQKSLTITEGQI